MVWLVRIDASLLRAPTTLMPRYVAQRLHGTMSTDSARHHGEFGELTCRRLALDREEGPVEEIAEQARDDARGSEDDNDGDGAEDDEVDGAAGAEVALEQDRTQLGPERIASEALSCRVCRVASHCHAMRAGGS